MSGAESDEDGEGGRGHAPPPRPAVPSRGVVVSAVYVYPIKSCRGVRVDGGGGAEVARCGFRYDRHWMLVDPAKYIFTSQRQNPAMVLIGTRTRTSARVRARGGGD